MGPRPDELDASPRPKDQFLGLDGLATLALALAVAGASLGITPLLCLMHVARGGRAVPDPAPGTARWVLVLGTALDGAVPGRAFAARLERARALAEADPSLRIAVLGGGTPSEAEAGAAWLHAAGIAPGRILAETRSRHTLENLRAFRDAVPAHGAALLVTSRSHLARAAAMADGFGLLVQPVAAADPAGLRRLPVEAFLLHWYLVGRAFARATRNRRMLARIA